MEYAIRPNMPGDEKQIIELLQLSFPDWASRSNPLEYWNWKYRGNDKSLFQVVLFGEKIVGCQGYVSCKVKIGEKIIKAYYRDDAATHPEYRGRGVYTKLVDYRKNTSIEIGDKNQFIYYLSTNPITIKNNIKSGSHYFPYPISHMIRIQNIEKHVKMTEQNHIKVTEIGLKILKTINKAEETFNKKDNKIDYKIAEIRIEDLDAESLWREIKQQYQFIIVKNNEYLQWRYGNPKNSEFIVHVASKDSETLGIIITEIKQGKYPQSYINELLVKPGRLEVAKNLLKEACNYFEELGVNAINYRVVKGSNLKKISKECGFIYISYLSNIHLFYHQNVGEDEKRVLNSATPDKLYFSYGDYY